MDVIVSLIFIFATADGLRQGLVRTIIQTLGWFLALAAAYIFHGFFFSLVNDHTGLYNLIADKASSEDFFISKMPLIVQDSIASGLADFLVKIISFILVIVFFRLIFLILTHLFSKKKRRGLIGFLDGFLGIFAGGAKGLILIFLFLAILIPFISLFPMNFIINALESSKIAGVLYDNNYLLLIAKIIPK